REPRLPGQSRPPATGSREPSLGASSGFPVVLFSVFFVRQSKAGKYRLKNDLVAPVVPCRGAEAKRIVYVVSKQFYEILYEPALQFRVIVTSNDPLALKSA